MKIEVECIWIRKVLCLPKLEKQGFGREQEGKKKREREKKKDRNVL